MTTPSKKITVPELSINGAAERAREAVLAASGHLGETREHLLEAASATAEAAREAVHSASSAARDGAGKVREAVGEAGKSSRAVGQDVKLAASEGLDAALSSAGTLATRTGELIRERPLAAIGVAFATGWLISRLLRR